MAQLLAPYHNGMRLGQGFNSYNQQICLDNAVLMDTDRNRGRVRPYYVPDPIHTEVDKLLMLPKTVKEQPDQDSPHIEAVDEDKPRLQPWVKPQIVTYSSRFVDKLQDVTESMNVSGALSIQTATVGGKGSGSYVDSDEFKSSDINFHLQVKVVNQIYKPEEYKLFNQIHNLPPSDFTATYGDCFISGWEEGGEFNAIVSMKVTDKSKVYKIKAELEGSIKGGVSIDAKISGEIDKENTDKSTETTIAVNWAGGGSVKSPEEPWTIETMTKAAAAFPDLVAMTPQRTYAILTKYTALESFQRQIQHYSILDYENASIYTNMLMDHFMEYKMMWKQLYVKFFYMPLPQSVRSTASYELQRGTARIDWAETPDEIEELATIRPLLDVEIGQKLQSSGRRLPESNGDVQEVHTFDATQVDYLLTLPQFVIDVLPRDIRDKVAAARNKKDAQPETQEPKKEDPTKDNTKHSVSLQLACGAIIKKNKDGTDTNPPLLQFRPFRPSVGGLLQARKVCRSEMAKIVNEVDLITKEPRLAIDTRRDELFLEPAVYKQLLPASLLFLQLSNHPLIGMQVVRTWSDDMLPDARMAEVPVILGYSAPAETSGRYPSVIKWLDTPGSAGVVTNPDLIRSIEKVKRKSKNYRMFGTAGTKQQLLPSAGIRTFNDLEGLDPTYRPLVVAIWTGTNIVQGIEIVYANGERKAHGYCPEDQNCFSIELDTRSDVGSEIIFEIQMGTSKAKVKGSNGEETVIGWMQLVTSTFRVLDTRQDKAKGPFPNRPKASPDQKVPSEAAADTKQSATEYVSGTSQQEGEIEGTPTPSKPETDPPTTFLRPDFGMWSLRGFFGYVRGATINTRFLSLGVVEGRDQFVPRPASKEFLPLCRAYSTLEDKEKALLDDLFKNRMKTFPGKLIMGELLTTGGKPAAGTTYFNHMDKLEIGWAIDYIRFCATTDGKLKGLEVRWTNGQKDLQGTIDNNNATPWDCKVAPYLLLNAKITTTTVNTAQRIQTVEFVRSDDVDGSLPSWLLDVNTLRYLGDAGPHKTEGCIIEAPPNHDAAVWSIRGFAGRVVNGGEIAALALIWGRDK